jgi:hypothetical protein
MYRVLGGLRCEQNNPTLLRIDPESSNQQPVAISTETFWPILGATNIFVQYHNSAWQMPCASTFGNLGMGFVSWRSQRQSLQDTSTKWRTKYEKYRDDVYVSETWVEPHSDMPWKLKCRFPTYASTGVCQFTLSAQLSSGRQWALHSRTTRVMRSQFCVQLQRQEIWGTNSGDYEKWSKCGRIWDNISSLATEALSENQERKLANEIIKHLCIYNCHNSGHYLSSSLLFKTNLNSTDLSVPHRKHISSPLRAQHDVSENEFCLRLKSGTYSDGPNRQSSVSGPE